MQLALERLERELLVERGSERAGRAVERFEQIGAAPELVAQVLGLGRACLGDGRLRAQPVDEPADDEPHEQLEPEREA